MATTKTGRRELKIRVLDRDGIRWVDVVRPSAGEMEWLKDNYAFHPLALEDCLSRAQIPKIDDYDKYLFIVLHFPVYNREARITLPAEVDMFVGPDYVVTVHDGNLKPLLRLFQECETDDETRSNTMRRSGGYLFYRVLDDLVDYCFPIVRKITENVDDIEFRVFDERTERLVREISVVRRDIIAYRRIVRPQIAVLEALEHRESTRSSRSTPTSILAT